MNDIIDLINESGFCEAEPLSDNRFSMRLARNLPAVVVKDSEYRRRLKRLTSLYAHVCSLKLGIKLSHSMVVRAAVRSYLDYTAEIMKKTA